MALRLSCPARMSSAPGGDGPPARTAGRGPVIRTAWRVRGARSPLHSGCEGTSRSRNGPRHAPALPRSLIGPTAGRAGACRGQCKAQTAGPGAHPLECADSLRAACMLRVRGQFIARRVRGQPAGCASADSLRPARARTACVLRVRGQLARCACGDSLRAAHARTVCRLRVRGQLACCAGADSLRAARAQTAGVLCVRGQQACCVHGQLACCACAASWRPALARAAACCACADSLHAARARTAGVLPVRGQLACCACADSLRAARARTRCVPRARGQLARRAGARLGLAEDWPWCRSRSRAASPRAARARAGAVPAGRQGM